MASRTGRLRGDGGDGAKVAARATGLNDGVEICSVIDFEQPDDVALDELGLFGEREEILPADSAVSRATQRP